MNLAVLTVIVCAAASPLLWPSSPESTDYPRYTATPPPTLLGAPLLTAMDGADEGTLAMWTETFGDSFSYAYGTAQQLTDNGDQPFAFVYGGLGDLRDAPSDLVRGYEQGLADSESTIDAIWDAPPEPAADGCVASRTPPTWRTRALTRRAVGPTGAASGPSS